MSEHKQSSMWRGKFGDNYVNRNELSQTHLDARHKMWKTIFKSIENERPESIFEVGANIGLNLRTLKSMYNPELYAVEPNAKARERLLEDKVITSENLADALAADIPFDDNIVDMAFSCTVLIHVPPTELLKACQELYRLSKKYIVCIEYFSPYEETIQYRDHSELLFKRDFGGFWMENFPKLELVDYGFFWKPAANLDNFTWWLFKKS